MNTVCPVCRGEGVDGEPGDEPGTGYTWNCEECEGTGRIADVGNQALTETLWNALEFVERQEGAEAVVVARSLREALEVCTGTPVPAKPIPDEMRSEEQVAAERMDDVERLLMRGLITPADYSRRMVAIDEALRSRVSGLRRCSACKGAGDREVLDTTRGPDGDTFTVDCERCAGTGRISL